MEDYATYAQNNLKTLGDFTNLFNNSFIIANVAFENSKFLACICNKIAINPLHSKKPAAYY